MKERDPGVLERNLALLLGRAWRPVKPDPTFVRRLERELAPWIRAERSRAAGGWSLAAAAAVLIGALLAWRGLAGGPAPAPVDLAGLLEAGEVALRVPPAGAWRAATARERETSILLGAGALEIATPSALGVRVAAGGEMRLELRPASRASLAREGPTLAVRLDAGEGRVQAGGRSAELRAPAEVLASAAHLQVFDGRAPEREPLDEEPGARRPIAPATLDGAVPAESQPAGPPAPERAGASLAGVVLDARSRRPIQAFELSLLRAVDLPGVSWPMSRSFESAGGDFRWDGLEPGTYAVFVQSEGFAAWRVRALALEEGASVALQVELGLGARVRGKVVDRESGMPIAGALVLSESDAPVQVLPLDAALLPAEVRAHALSGPDGSFELPHLAAGAQVLRASAAGHGQRRTGTLELREGESSEGILFQLGPAGRLFGRVEREAGSPWSGARVVASEYSIRSSGPMSFGTALTDEHGSYAIQGLGPGPYVVLVAPDEAASEDVRPDISAIELREGAELQVDFLRGTRNARLFGRVLDARGAPRAGLTVNLSPVGSDDPSGWRAASAGEDGSYALDDLAPGAYQVHVGLGSTIVLLATVELRTGVDRELDLSLGERRLHGRVREAATGEPLPGYTLLLCERADPRSAERFPALDRLVAKAWAAGSSTYEIPSLAPGDYDLVVLGAGERHALLVIEDIAFDGRADVELDLELELAGTLHVVARDQAGKPLRDVRVVLVDPLGRRLDLLESRTKADGGARLASLAPGSWRVLADGGEHGRAEASIAIEAGAVRELDLRLRP